MYRRFNRTTDAVLEKFFYENLKELNTAVRQELEILQRTPTKRGIYMSLIDLHKEFSHVLGKINAFKHSPTYRSIFKFRRFLEVKLHLTFCQLAIIVAALEDCRISPNVASQKINQEVTNLLINITPTQDGSIRSKAA